MRYLCSALLAVCCGPLALAAGEGKLQLSAPLEYTPSITTPRAVALADITRDGNLDAVVVGTGLNALYAIYEGEGDGTFGAEIAKANLYLDPVGVVVDDFDGDGNLDIAAINSACG